MLSFDVLNQLHHQRAADTNTTGSHFINLRVVVSIMVIGFNCSCCQMKDSTTRFLHKA